MSSSQRDTEMKAASSEEFPSEGNDAANDVAQSERAEEEASSRAPINYTARKMAVAALAGSALLCLTVVTGILDPTDILF